MRLRDMCSYGKYRNRLFTPVTEPLSVTGTKIHNFMDLSKHNPQNYESK